MLVFDLETDGLLDTVTKIHCLNMIDTEAGDRLRFNNGKYGDGTKAPRDGCIEDALVWLSEEDRIAGQNIIKYDIPVIQKLCSGWQPKGRVFDTRVASQVIWTNMADLDFAMLRSGKLPPEFQKAGLIGRHKLAAWGYRLGLHKGDFNPEDYGHTWATMPFTKDMDDYCALDCEVTLKWIEKIESKNYSQECLDLEHRVAEIIAQQERNGFCFDVKAAEKLYAELQSKRAALTDELTQLFPPWKKKDGKPFVPKRDNAKLGYKAGVPVQKYKTVVFNPASRDHIADRLMTLHGWKPEAFTDGGKPKVDETILSALTYPEASKLSEYMLLEKRLGQIGDGDQAWLKQERNGRIHGTVNTNGAVTGRMTHSNPNVAQVPKVGSAYGEECRALFGVPPDKVQVGADASGIELRCLGHFLSRYDGGEYARAVVDGKSENETDVHSMTCKALGLKPKKVYSVNGKQVKGRDIAKTFVYALLYGAGAAKLARILGKSEKQGAQVKRKFLTNWPALDSLLKDIERAVKKRGWLYGLDRRKLHVRSAHAALNTLLQSAGAVLMKQATVFVDDELKARNLAHKVKLIATVHDEWQFETDPDIGEEVGKIAVGAIRRAGEHFKFRCVLAGEWKVGKNWAECH